ncbi:MAG: hypothetical protein JW800_00215 [Candidatus Omnitrophica bacterium]|nr:hypothetical protein [Candidatus Omnitrophota bacterium]
MALQLFMRPEDVPVSWDEFRKKTPKFSIALDGYVNDGPLFDYSGPWANFNHHENVDRMATRSTCAQVLIAIRQDLFNCFNDGKGACANIYVNDCDEDVSLSWFLIENYKLIENALNIAITRLVSIEDLLDVTAGAYPFPIDLDELQKIGWVFEPYRKFRLNGGLDRKHKKEYLEIIGQVGERIASYVKNKAKKVPLNTQYKKIGGGKDWTMVEEIGADARTGLYRDNLHAYVSVRKINDKRWVYTIGRMSLCIPFDIQKILTALNKEEANPVDKWGGSNTIGGSPRVNASKLPPQEVAKIINSAIQ